MLAVKPAGLRSSDEELAAVRIFACVCHGQAVWFVLQLEVFVFESPSPDRSAAGPVTTCEISTLDHEIRDDSVELAVSVG